MPRFIRIFPLAGIFLVALAACAPLTVSTPDSNALGTMVAQTVFAGLTQQGFPPGAAQTETLLPEITPTFTPTLPPTLTPTLTETPVPIFTPTPAVPLISVSVPINCRVGPGRIYDRVGALPVGIFAEVLGRDPTGNYWYIRKALVHKSRRKRNLPIHLGRLGNLVRLRHTQVRHSIQSGATDESLCRLCFE